MALLRAFMDGVTGAGLFGRVTWPGGPTVLIDSRSLAEFKAGMAGFHYPAERSKGDPAIVALEAGSRK